MPMTKCVSYQNFIVSWAALLFFAVTQSGTTYAQTKTFNPFASDGKTVKHSDATPVIFEDITLTGEKTTIDVSLDPQVALRFTNSNPGDIYSISIETDTPGPISMRMLQIELNGKNQALGQTTLLKADVTGGTAAALRLPDTLLPTGPLFLGIAGRGTLKGTVTIRIDPATNASAWTADTAIGAGHDMLSLTGAPYSCFSFKQAKAGLNAHLISVPRNRLMLELSSEDSDVRSAEVLDLRSSLKMLGISPKKASGACVRAPQSKSPIRLKLTASESVEEPNAELKPSALPLLSVNGRLTFNHFPGDVDAFRLAPAPRGKAHRIMLSEIYDAKTCVFDAKDRNRISSECVSGTREFGPLLGGDDYIVKVLNVLGPSENYTVSSTLIDFDASVERWEPNQLNRFSAGDSPLMAQAPPAPSAKTGLVRLKGSHVSNDDTDSYHWADIDTEQMWRIRAIGPALRNGSVMINKKEVAKLTRPPGITGRLIADDVFLKTGMATVNLNGGEGDYTVLFRPLGPPAKGQALENGADGEGPYLAFGETVRGRLSRGDKDSYRISLTRPVSARVTLTPPIGAETNIYLGDVTQKALNVSAQGGEARSFDLRIPAGNHTLDLTPKIPSPMDYTLTLERRNPYTPDNASVDMTLVKPVPVRAWSDDLQTIYVPVTLTNKTQNIMEGRIIFETPSHQILASPQDLLLLPGETLTQSVEVRVTADLPPRDYQLMMGFETASEDFVGSLDAVLAASIDAPVGRGGKFPALPLELLGSVDMAHYARGAKWTGKDAGPRDFVNKLDNAIDGLLLIQENFQPTFRFGRKTHDGHFDLQISGDTPVTLRGAGFQLVGTWQTMLGDLEIHTSTDGEAFEPWISGTHDVFDQRQYMTGPDRAATHIRLVLKSGADQPEWTRLSELYIFAAPGKSGLPAQDLLRPGFGSKTHLNDGSPDEQTRMKATQNGAFLFKTEAGKTAVKIGHPISFNNLLPVKIESVAVEWVKPETIRYTPVTGIRVMASQRVDGPWEEIGRTDIPDPKTTPIFTYELPERARLRFLRLDYEGGDGWHALPARISAYERAEGDGYISALGEWGKRSDRVLSDAPIQNGGTLKTDGVNAKGEVQYQRDEDSWTIDVADSENTLIFDVEGSPGFRPELTLSQSANTILPRSIDPIPGTNAERYSYTVTPGSAAVLTVTEDKRSTVILLKQSGEMRAFRSAILNGIAKLSDDMVAGRDAISLTGMGKNKRFDWVTDPDKVARVLVDHFDNNPANEADSTGLAQAARAIKSRTGSKAILMISDGNSSDGDNGLETALRASGARLFIAKPPGSVVRTESVYTHSPTNDVLTGWAQMAGGDVQFTTTLEGYENLFSRVSAKIAGPKTYLVSAKADWQVSKPGFLNVVSAPDVPQEARPVRTQMVLLDTSGSMLKRIGDTRRYIIAQKALSEYVKTQKTADASERFDAIGLRLFGGPPDRCETTLDIAPIPLEDSAFLDAIKKVTPRNNAKTPIAAALKAAGQDLVNVEGETSLLLVTDGEETCDGDPLAEINALRKADVETRLDVVSFALGEQIDRSPFKAWAEAGGGRYVDAQTAQDLTDAVAQTGAVTYQLYQGETLIMSGRVGVVSEELSPGPYEIAFSDDGTRYPVVIRADKTVDFTPSN